MLLSSLSGRAHTSVSARVSLVYGHCPLLGGSSLSRPVADILCSAPEPRIPVSPAVSPAVTFCSIDPGFLKSDASSLGI